MFNSIDLINPDLFRGKGIHEQRMNNLIKTGEGYFYLDLFEKSGSNLEKQGLFLARRELIKNGLAVCVMGRDSYGVGVEKIPSFIEEQIKFNPKKLIIVTYQSHKVPLLKKYPLINDRDVWREVWRDTFNNWINDYLPKIKSEI